jgi:hypothetical protein
MCYLFKSVLRRMRYFTLVGLIDFDRDISTHYTGSIGCNMIHSFMSSEHNDRYRCKYPHAWRLILLLESINSMSYVYIQRIRLLFS